MALGEMVPWRWGSFRRAGRDDKALEGFRGDIASLHREMDRLFESLWHEGFGPSLVSGELARFEIAPQLDVAEDDKSITVKVDLPGMDEVFAHQIHHLADPVDIALGISSDGECENVLRGLQVSRQLGLLTIALTGGSGGKIASAELDHVLNVRSSDPRVVKEMHVTTYHVLWELVQVFFEQPSCLESEVVK